jgi:hypothetical protein
MERRYNHQLTSKLRIAASAANQQRDFSLKLKCPALVWQPFRLTASEHAIRTRHIYDVHNAPSCVDG